LSLPAGREQVPESRLSSLAGMAVAVTAPGDSGTLR